MQTDGTRLSIPEYWQTWDTDSVCPVITKGMIQEHDWTSDTTGDVVSVPFRGKRVSVSGKSDNEAGYAWIRISDKDGQMLQSSLVDFYSKVENLAPLFVSKEYSVGDYVLEVEVSGEYPVWYKKDGTRFGSSDCKVNVAAAIFE